MRFKRVNKSSLNVKGRFGIPLARCGLAEAMLAAAAAAAAAATSGAPRKRTAGQADGDAACKKKCTVGALIRKRAIRQLTIRKRAIRQLTIRKRAFR